MKQPLKIGVIIILYDCDTIKISAKILPQNTILIIVDNTPNQDLKLQEKNIFYIPLYNNYGIAEAQNKGINFAIQQKCSHIIFFDQDSSVGNTFIKDIFDEYNRINLIYPNLFLLGPTTCNGRTREEYKSTIHPDHQTEYDFIPRREIISSGSCVSTEKIKQVGLLDSKLFIDFVDFEWCWRANAKKYISGITPHVKLTHFIGQTEYKILNQLVIISSPIRYFYQTRNYLWLLKRSYVPIQWKINNGIKRIIHILSFPFKTPTWKQIYKNIYKGFLAGIKSPQ